MSHRLFCGSKAKSLLEMHKTGQHGGAGQNHFHLKKIRYLYSTPLIALLWIPSRNSQLSRRTKCKPFHRTPTGAPLQQKYLSPYPQDKFLFTQEEEGVPPLTYSSDITCRLFLAELLLNSCSPSDSLAVHCVNSLQFFVPFINAFLRLFLKKTFNPDSVFQYSPSLPNSQQFNKHSPQTLF